MDVLVTYDISTIDPEGERRLRAVAQVCERFGVRTQYSVFECRLSAASLQRMTNELLTVIEPRDDSVFIYRFPGDLNGAKTALGRSAPQLGAPWII